MLTMGTNIRLTLFHPAVSLYPGKFSLTTEYVAIAGVPIRFGRLDKVVQIHRGPAAAIGDE
jgi:hypothetical protein